MADQADPVPLVPDAQPAALSTAPERLDIPPELAREFLEVLVAATAEAETYRRTNHPTLAKRAQRQACDLVAYLRSRYGRKPTRMSQDERGGSEAC